MPRYSDRPFPPYRHLPGSTPHPERDPQGHMYGAALPPAVPLTAEGWPRNEDYLFGVDLFNAGYYWEAHVFWERLWAVEGIDRTVRDFLQGLVQLAAACLKVRQGELGGARKLSDRARASLRRAQADSEPGPTVLGVDASAVGREVARFVSSAGPAPALELERATE